MRVTRVTRVTRRKSGRDGDLPAGGAGQPAGRGGFAGRGTVVGHRGFAGRGGFAGRLVGVAAVAALAVVGTGASVLLTAPGAAADTAPPDPSTPATVSADALPTVQVNGVVWAQATVGNTVFVTGSFTAARPAGAAAGVNETPRGNLLAYDITTGNLIAGFNHTLNAQGRAITASPDGRRIYVGGDFTAVDGQTRNRIAAFNTVDGSLVSGWTGGAAASVRALTASDSTLYAGGVFASAMGNTRSRLAAYSTSTGALLNWAPAAANGQVNAMVLTPDRSRVIVGGQFNSLNGVSATGLGAVDATTGATLPWAANKIVRNSGDKASIDSLRTDGTNIYGSGWVSGATSGNLEGSFAANPTTGDLIWIEDCHGDTYDNFAVGGVLYNVGHAHFCGNIGAFPQTDPMSYYRALAFTTKATGTVGRNTLIGYADFAGNPAPTQLNWYPKLAAGTFTGQGQAAWSITGNSSYLSLGGEFPSVNGTPQQGLVRFAIRAVAPNRVGPVYSAAALTPTVQAVGAGSARVSWTTTYDNDNEALTYRIVRDGNTASPVHTTTINGRFWKPQPATFVDTGLSAGTHTYRVYVSDPLGNVTPGPTSAPVTVTGAGPAPTSAYARTVLADGPANYWRLGETAGTTTSRDLAGGADLRLGSTVTRGTPGAIAGDADTASTFSGTSTGFGATPTAVTAPATFSAEAWFNTTSTRGGKLLGFGGSNTGTSFSYDRHVYLTNAGRVTFGVNPGGFRTITSAGAYNDGRWHHVVATLSSAGMSLYVDGAQVGQDPATTSAQAFSGYWRVGGDALGFWPDRPTSNFLAGAIDEVAIYPTALTPAQVQRHNQAGRTN
ncbi:LamG-like jellyroll fold domain-containing protein [Frankia sp. R43]|uniref:LamG-like jellyroll fold domain-containing protein n=1 Tax=Frankia sp. R43 TaxID=269536 RepID=UPI0006CA196E|nr:LamG-like jellyroll fold domain-containing protein [Frankia sp. R43]